MNMFDWVVPRWLRSTEAEVEPPVPKKEVVPKKRRQPTCKLCSVRENARVPLKGHRCPYAPRNRPPSPSHAPTVPLPEDTVQSASSEPEPEPEPSRPRRAVAPVQFTNDNTSTSTDTPHEREDSSYEEEEDQYEEDDNAMEVEAVEPPVEAARPPEPSVEEDSSSSSSQQSKPPRKRRRTGKDSCEGINEQVGPVPEPGDLIVIQSDRLFVDDHKLGQGSYGYVRKGQFDGAPVAVKIVFDKLEAEARCMQNLRHPNILSYYGMCPGHGCLVLELCEGDLGAIMCSLEPRQMLDVAMQVAYGICYLHQQGVTHRDLKPANILMKNGVPKLADFGISKQITDINNTKIGTPYYMAPEILEGKYTSTIDIYAFGLILHEMMSRERIQDTIFRGMDSFRVCEKVRGGLKPIIPKCWHSRPRVLLRRMWKRPPEKRAKIQQVIELLREIEETDFPPKT